MAISTKNSTTILSESRLADSTDWDDMVNDLQNLDSNKVEKVAGKVLSDNNYTTTEKNKVANVPADTNTELANKVDKVAGKGLSKNDYTDAEKSKLTSLSITYVGTYLNLTALQTAYPTGQPGYEAIIDGGAGSNPKKAFWDASDNQWYFLSGIGASSFAELGGSPNDNAALAAALAAKVNEVAGKGLSANDFTNTYKGQLDNAPANINTAFAGKMDAAPVQVVTTSGTITINGLVCNKITLDVAGKSNAAFKYVGNTTPIGIDVINASEGAIINFEIQRTNSDPMAIRFNQGTNLMNGTQRINGGADSLWIFGATSATHVSAVLDFQIINRQSAIRQIVTLKEQSSLLDSDYESLISVAKARGDKLPSVPNQILQNNLMVALKAASTSGLAGYGDIVIFANDILFSGDARVPANLGFTGLHWTNSSIATSRVDYIRKSNRGVRPVNSGSSKLTMGTNMATDVDMLVTSLGYCMWLDTATPVSTGVSQYFNTNVNTGNGTFIHLQTGPNASSNGSRFYSIGDPSYADHTKRPIGTGYFGAEMVGSGSNNHVMYNSSGIGTPETRTPGTKGGIITLFGGASTGTTDTTVVSPAYIVYDPAIVNRVAMITAVNNYLDALAAL